MTDIEKISPDDADLERIARKKVTCPFMGPLVRRSELALFGSTERPMASVADIARLGDSGGGDLGRRVLRLFAIGNHRRMPGPSGGFDKAVPDEDMISLDLAGSQGAHAGHSGIMLGDPDKLDAGRFSAEAFARLAAHAVADGRLTMKGAGKFIAENIARDDAARVFPVGLLARDLFGVADEVFDNLGARLLGRKTERDDAELVERITKLAGADNLIGSSGEFGLLFAFFANRPGANADTKGNDDDEQSLDLTEIEAMMRDLRLPEGWESWPKHAHDWVKATTAIAAYAMGSRLKNLI